jgi:hypothetical protein
MSIHPHSALCLGGPLDGQIIPAREAYAVGVSPIVGSELEAGFLGYREVRYQRRRLAGRDDRELVWRELVVYACEDITDDLDLYARLVGHLVKLAIGQAYVGEQRLGGDELERALERRRLAETGERVDGGRSVH